MPTNKKKRWFDKFATKAPKTAGSNYALIIAVAITFVWIISGPIFIIRIPGNWSLTPVQRSSFF